QAAHLLDQRVGGQPKAAEVADTVADEGDKVLVPDLTDQGCPHGFAPFARPSRWRSQSVRTMSVELREPGAASPWVPRLDQTPAGRPPPGIRQQNQQCTRKSGISPYSCGPQGRVVSFFTGRRGSGRAGREAGRTAAARQEPRPCVH